MLNKYLTRNDESIAYRMIDDEVIVVNLEKSNFHTFNAVGAFIWDRLDGKKSVKMIITDVADEFDVDITTAEKDTIEFINSMLNEDLLIESSY
jgi:methyltransferase-like protein